MSKIHVPIKIITCPAWGAVRPNHPIQNTGRPADKIIIHHTAGHHPELGNPADESRIESVRYARSIQAFHMGPSRGWNDSGHNFLVCRNGLILQGRWHTVAQIENNSMVVSAHCPGQNDQVGIEHEHLGSEAMTPAQFTASAQLIAWISGQYGYAEALPLHPHHEFFPTGCPANLEANIPSLYQAANKVLSIIEERSL